MLLDQPDVLVKGPAVEPLALRDFLAALRERFGQVAPRQRQGETAGQERSRVVVILEEPLLAFRRRREEPDDVRGCAPARRETAGSRLCAVREPR